MLGERGGRFNLPRGAMRREKGREIKQALSSTKKRGCQLARLTAQKMQLDRIVIRQDDIR